MTIDTQLVNITEIRGPSGDSLADFKEDQWWMEELNKTVENGTPDQKRAVAVVKNLLDTVKCVTTYFKDHQPVVGSLHSGHLVMPPLKPNYGSWPHYWTNAVAFGITRTRKEAQAVADNVDKRTSISRVHYLKIGNHLYRVNAIPLNIDLANVELGHSDLDVFLTKESK